IYERPQNLFVAKFIGSPAMNVLPGRIARQGDTITALHEPTGVTMDLAGYRFSERPQEGQSVLVGLRPEHFSVGPPNGRTAAVFDLALKHHEKTGNEATAFLGAGEELLAVK